MEQILNNGIKTNQDVLDWAKENEGKSQDTPLDAAKVFFGSFNGGKQKMSKDIEN